MLQLVVQYAHDVAGHRPATSWVYCTTSCNTQSSAPEDWRYYRPKHAELIGIINKQWLLHVVGCLYYLYQQCTVKQISNLFTYLLTPWSRVLLDKPSDSQLVKKFTTFCGTLKIFSAFTRTHNPSLSSARLIQSIHPHPTSWWSVLILSSHLRLCLPSGLFPVITYTSMKW